MKHSDGKGQAIAGIISVSFVFLFGILMLPSPASATTETVTFTAGTYSWTAPQGVATVSAEVWAGGGGGAGGANGSCCGGGGAGGAYARSLVNVVAGNAYTLVVGTGGTAGASTPGAGGPGNDSMFFSSTTVLAKGGGGGQTGANGAGGTATAGSVGTTTFSGGNGGAGVSAASSGGGGGGAGSSGNGTAGSGINNGTGGAGGGGNGAPGLGTGSNLGLTATSTAGGGSGGDRTSGASKGGGAGADGFAKITYDVYTIVANASDPGNSTIAPGAGTTTVDAFTLQTGTSTDSVTSVTVKLGTNAYQGVSCVAITDNADTTTYGTTCNPGSDSVTITTSGLTASVALTTYHVRIKPYSHANMPAPQGASYAVTASTTAIASTNAGKYSDVAGATITIDNLSPGNVTGSTASGDDSTVNFSWTNPGDADLSAIVVLRSTSAVTDVPVEGSSYSNGNTIGAATVVCVTGVATSCSDSTVTNGTPYYFKIFTKDSNGNYSTGVAPSGSPVTPHAPVTTQERYIFLNDSGSTTDAYTLAHSAATSTAISGVKKGERMIARIQLSNTDTATNTYAFRLQWENNTDNPNVWNDLSTTTEIRWSLSSVGALPSRSGEVPLTSAQVGTCTTTTAYVAGRFVAGTATATPFAFGPSKCTEFAFAIDTSGATLGKTYRLRVSNGTGNKALYAYGAYPTLTMESAQSIRYSKEVRGGVATSTIDIGNGVQYSSVAIGSDGFPVFAYDDTTTNNSYVAHCNDTGCSSVTKTKIDAGAANTGNFLSLAIGSDGYPIVSSFTLNSRIDIAKCGNVTCTSVATSTIDANGGDSIGRDSAIAIGSDGLPILVFNDQTLNKVLFMKCKDLSCATVSTTTVDKYSNANFVYASISVNGDGFPIMSYIRNTTGFTTFARCTALDCSSISTTTIDTVSANQQNTAIALGSNGFPMIAYQDSGSKKLLYARCNDLACSSVSSTTVDASINSVNGNRIGLALGVDGTPLIAYTPGNPSGTSYWLAVLHCLNTSCTSVASTTVDASSTRTGLEPSLAIGSDGFPVIAYGDAANNLEMFARCSSLYCNSAASSSANLPSTNADFDYHLDDAGYSNVASSDNIYDSLQVASSSRGGYLFAKKATSSQYPVTVSWEGQLSVATTTYLKIYNNSSGLWEVLASSTSPTPNSDFMLVGTTSGSLSSYYDGSNVVYARLETGTTTAPLTLKTDQISFSITPAVITQRAYVFMNDDQGNVNSYTLTHGAATSTSVSGVKIGERMIVRVQLDNTSASASSTLSLRMQWENNTDNPGVWNDLGTSTAMRWSLSEKGAMSGRSMAPPLTSQQVGTCTSGTSFISGEFVAGAGTGTPIVIGPNKCTEIAFAIQTSGAAAGKTYRLRLIDGGRNSLLDAYSAYPTFQTGANIDTRYSVEARGDTASTTLDTGAWDTGYATSLAIGPDGSPVISYKGGQFGAVMVAKCTDSICSSRSKNVLDPGSGTISGYSTSIAIGSDGLPVVAFADAPSENLIFAKCNTANCSSAATSTLDSGASLGGISVSVAIGSDGFPVMAYTKASGAINLYFIKCGNVSCSSFASSTLVSGGNLGSKTSVAIGVDGYPVISYQDLNTNSLKVVKCNDLSCGSAAINTIDDPANTVGDYSSIAIGSAGYPIVSYYDTTAGDLKFAKCNDISCSSSTVSTIESANNVGTYTSIAVGTDGNPVIAYRDETLAAPKFLRCTNTSCTATTSVVLVDIASSRQGLYDSLAIGSDGLPMISFQDQIFGPALPGLHTIHCASVDCSPSASSSANLPADSGDLDTYLDEAAYANVNTSDNAYDTLVVATSSRGAYLFTKRTTASGYAITASWEGQLSVATTTYLKIYNYATNAWEVLGSSTTPPTGSDFTMGATQSSNLSQYYSSSSVVSIRVETGTTSSSTLLKTDYFNISLQSSGTVTQRAYVFLNDNGTTTDGYTQAHSAATSTSISSVKKGERLVVRFQVDNTDASASSTMTYRLQWQNNTDNPNNWYDVDKGSEISWTNSNTGAPPARYGQVPIISNQVGSCTGGTTFVSGRFIAGINTSAPFVLGTSTCTEFDYAIDLSFAKLGKTYRLRLIDGTRNAPLGAYTVYPTFSMESAQNIRYSREARGGYASTTKDTGTDQEISTAIGSDGLPLVSYMESASPVKNKLLRCLDIVCSSSVTSVIDAANGLYGYNSVAIGSDGLPIVAYDRSSFLAIGRCADIGCSSVATNTILDVNSNVGQFMSIAIGSDGFPVVSYYGVNQLRFAKCNNLSCTSAATTTLDVGSFLGEYTSIAIGSDGFPVILYYENNFHSLKFAKCNDLACLSAATSTFDANGSLNDSISIGSDGYPIIAYGNKFAKCLDLFCSSVSSTTLDAGAGKTSIATMNGYPVISYAGPGNASLRLAICNDVACSSVATSTIDSGTGVGTYNALAVNTDGSLSIAYSANSALIFLKCTDLSCSSSANLPSGNGDLDIHLDDDGYANVANSDNSYDSLTSGTSSRLAYLFTRKNSNATDNIIASWEGQVSLATTTYLKIYNIANGQWETLASNSSPTANTDFTLSGTQSSNVANYYDSNDVAYLRVETGTTTAPTTLKTDQISLTFGSSGANQSILHYRWRNDDGSESAASYAKGEDTAIGPSDMFYKGDRLRLRMLVSNAGGADASNITYRLEYSSSSCANWMTVPSFNTQGSEEWVTDLSQWLPDNALTTDSAGLTDPNGKSFVSGYAKLNTNTTPAHTLTSSQFTELEYAIRSTVYAQAGIVYCFRLTNGGVTTNFTYSVQPQVTLNPRPRPQTGGSGIENNGAGSSHNGGGAQGGSDTTGGTGGGASHNGGSAGGGGDSG